MWRISIFRYEYILTFVHVKFDCTNIFGYSFVSVLECKICLNIWIFAQFSIQIFIQTFVCVKLVTRIYSDIRLCKFFDANIFGYSFVSKKLRMSHSGIYQYNVCTLQFTTFSGSMYTNITSANHPKPTKTKIQLLVTHIAFLKSFT